MTATPTDRITEFLPSQIWSTFALGCAALLVTGVQPVTLGALIEAGVVDLQSAGRLITIEAFALAAGMIIATALLPSTALRKIGLFCSIGLCVANLASAATDDFTVLAVSRALAGFMGGALLWVVTSVIVRTKRPERLAGYFMAGYTICQALVVLLIALFFIPWLGWKGCYLAIALMISFSILLSLLLPTKLRELPSASASHKLQLSPSIIFGGCVIFLQMVMAIAIWAFIEPIGRQTGLEPQTIQLIVSASLVVQVFGAAAAGFLAPRLPAATILLLLSIVVFGIAIYLLRIVQFPPNLFMPAAFVFSFAWMFILPFQTKLSLDVDPTGRFALTVPFLQLMAGAVAPITAGEVADGGVASDVAWLSAVCAAIGAIILVGMVVRGAQLVSVQKLR